MLEPKFGYKGIGRFLTEDRLFVPAYQREYAWEKDQVEELLTDYADAMDSTEGTHFLGTIVLTPGDDGRLEVSDGQQRLATNTMILAVLRDILLNLGKTKDGESVEHDFLLRYDRDTGDHAPRLTLNTGDHTYFQDTIVKPPADRQQRKKKDERKDSHKAIDAAAKIIREHLNHRIAFEPLERRPKIINKWVEFVHNKALVITIQAPLDLDAFTMFETLNDRGLETSKADLLKVRLFNKIGKSREREAQEKWASMTGSLESLSRKNITVTFIRHLLICKHGPTKEKHVLRKVKEEIGEKPSVAIEFLDSMLDAAEDYVAMLNPTHSKWKAYGDTAQEHLWIIKDELDVQQVMPLLFSVIRTFPIAQAKFAIKFLLNVSVRFLIVGGGSGGLLDRHYAIAAKNIHDGTIGTAADLANALKDISPNDEQFELEFANARVSESRLARYYLHAMEKANNQLPSPEVTPVKDRNLMTLEHILPVKSGSNWPTFTAADAKAYYRRIGNLVLMQASQNVLVGNMSFADKKPHLTKSALSLTKMAGKASKWDQDEIVKRQQELAKIAVKTWPIIVQ